MTETSTDTFFFLNLSKIIDISIKMLIQSEAEKLVDILYFYSSLFSVIAQNTSNMETIWFRCDHVSSDGRI